MTKKQKLELIGKVVTVKEEVKFFYDDDNKRYCIIVKNENARAGWIVGFRSLREGRIVIESNDSFYGSNKYFETTHTVPVVLISYWPTLKPVPVPLDGFELGGEPEVPGNWTEENRKKVSDIVKRKYPRDSKGRFV